MSNNQAERINGELLFMAYTVIFTIGPSFTKVLGQPISRIATLVTVPILFFLNAGKMRFCRKDIFYVFVFSFLLKLIPYMANGEPDRIVVETIEVFLPLMLIFFVFHHDHSLIEKTITIVIVTSAIICVFGLVEEFFHFNVFSLIENYQFANPRLGTNTTFRWGVYRIEQGFNTSLTYELYLAMCIGLTFYRFFVASNSKIRYVIILFLQIVNCILTMSRGITLVLGCGIIGIIVLNKKKIKIRFIILSIIILLTSIYLLAHFQKDLFEGFGNVFESIFSILRTGNGGAFDDNSISDRHFFQSRAFEALENPRNLFFGIGEEGLRALRTIDNDWLLEITAFGVFGLISFGILTLYPLAFSVNKWLYLTKKRSTESNEKQIVFYKCMTMTFLIYALSLFTVAQMEEARMFYLLIGISCFYFVLKDEQEPCLAQRDFDTEGRN